MKDYRELVVWQKAMDLVELVYRTTDRFPPKQLYGLAAQICRAAVSIPSHIAEGQGRHSTRDLLHFLSIARGSLKEVETQVLIAQRLGYIDQGMRTNLLELAAEVSRLISGLAKSLRGKAI